MTYITCKDQVHKQWSIKQQKGLIDEGRQNIDIYYYYLHALLSCTIFTTMFVQLKLKSKYKFMYAVIYVK